MILLALAGIALPNSTSSEESFAWHDGCLNFNHLCHTSAGDVVWMVR